LRKGQVKRRTGGTPVVWIPAVHRLGLLASVVLIGLGTCGAAGAYGWPVKPFARTHAIRGAFDDPRYHLGSEGALSAFHFGVDIAVRDGTAVYAVTPGFVRRRAADVTVRRPNGRAFGYWHIRPVVRTGQHVRLHQLLGHVLPGWGHVHFAESIDGEYRNPLRRGALTPFRDRTKPTVASITMLVNDGSAVDTNRVTGVVDVESEIYDTPPVVPRPPWQVARLAPAIVWWRLARGGVAVTDWTVAIDFHFALMPAGMYGWLYAPGTYQNKANRPGHYVFWLAHALDTSTLPNGRYALDVLAADTRWNVGSASLAFTIANASASPGIVIAPGMQSRARKPV
jgi:murein DD-endopeptidase MepM/ murein hydrolase activator NlpD